MKKASKHKMTKMTIYDFKRYIDSRNVKRIIYSTENQDDFNAWSYDIMPCIKFELQFENISISYNPPLQHIYLGLLPHNKHSNLVINCIEYIQIEYNMLGDIVHIYTSGDKWKGGEGRRYTIVIQYE